MEKSEKQFGSIKWSFRVGDIFSHLRNDQLIQIKVRHCGRIVAKDLQLCPTFNLMRLELFYFEKDWWEMSIFTCAELIHTPKTFVTLEWQNQVVWKLWRSFFFSAFLSFLFFLNQLWQISSALSKATSAWVPIFLLMEICTDNNQSCSFHLTVWLISLSKQLYGKKNIYIS